jgi:glycosyltransferase involved in cell wall biosynthesis
MIIAFNATAANVGTSGFVHATNLIGALCPLVQPHRIVVLTMPWQEPFRQAMPQKVDHLVLRDAPRGAFQRTAWLQWRLPVLLREKAVDVLYNKGNFHLYRNLVKQVCFLENANPFSRIPMAQPVSARLRNRLLLTMSRSALRHAAAVVFPSRTACERILAQTPAHGTVAVVPYGWSPSPESPVPITVDEPYILAVSSLYPHRNLTTAADALAELHARGTFRGTLLIIGSTGSAAYARGFKHHVDRSPVRRHVRLLPSMTSGELTNYYRRAAVTLMPSIEETFGIPLIESMGIGAPVVASLVVGPSAGRYFIPFAEICGDAAEYFNPFSAVSCADAVQRALSEPRRSEMIRLGAERVRAYSWEAAGRLTWDVLRGAAAP